MGTDTVWKRNPVGTDRNASPEQIADKRIADRKTPENLKGQRKETIATEVHDEKKDDNGPDADDSAVYRYFAHRLCGAAE